MNYSYKPSFIPFPSPNTFAGLMELYETNYINIRKLCGDLNDLSDYSVSSIQQGMDLHLSVLEKNKYTITLYLTYRFAQTEAGQSNEFPGATIRVYYDAMQAEVLDRTSKVLKSQSYSTNNLYQKWTSNRFLFKWLNFSLRQGHSFNLSN
jgi:uncharacterized protein YqiB (DUF1249 family)